MSKKDEKPATSPKMGRPKRMSDEDIVHIVDMYFLTKGNSDPEIMAKKQIYGAIAKFANNEIEGIPPMKGYHFSRCQAAKERIAELAKPVHEVGRTVGVAFSPLNIASMEMKSKEDIIVILQQREEYFSKLYDSAARMIEENTRLRSEREADTKRICQLENTIKEKDDEISQMNHEISQLNQQNSQYKKIINTDMAPKIAELLQESMPQPGVNSDEAVVKMHEIGEQSMKDLIGAEMKQPTKNEASKFDPIALFRGDNSDS